MLSTRAEFERAADDEQSFELRIMQAQLVLPLGYAFSFAIVATLLWRIVFGPAVFPSFGLGLLGVLLFISPPIATVLILSRLRVVWQTQPDAANCPWCAADLAKMKGFVLVTGNCTECGRQVVPPRSPKEAKPAAELWTIERFKDAHANHQRWSLVGLAILVGCTFSSLGASAGMMFWFTREALVAHYGENLAMTLLMGLMVSGLPLGFLFAWPAFQIGDDAQPRCPSCDARLAMATSLVIATRHCPECSSRVVEDPREIDQEPTGTRESTE